MNKGGKFFLFYLHSGKQVEYAGKHHEEVYKYFLKSLPEEILAVKLEDSSWGSVWFCFHPTSIIGPNMNTEQVPAYFINFELEKKPCNCFPHPLQNF